MAIDPTIKPVFFDTVFVHTAIQFAAALAGIALICYGAVTANQGALVDGGGLLGAAGLIAYKP